MLTCVTIRLRTLVVFKATSHPLFPPPSKRRCFPRQRRVGCCVGRGICGRFLVDVNGEWSCIPTSHTAEAVQVPRVLHSSRGKQGIKQKSLSCVKISVGWRDEGAAAGGVHGQSPEWWSLGDDPRSSRSHTVWLSIEKFWQFWRTHSHVKQGVPPESAEALAQFAPTVTIRSQPFLLFFIFFSVACQILGQGGLFRQLVQVLRGQDGVGGLKAVRTGTATAAVLKHLLPKTAGSAPTADR